MIKEWIESPDDLYMNGQKGPAYLIDAQEELITYPYIQNQIGESGKVGYLTPNAGTALEFTYILRFEQSERSMDDFALWHSDQAFVFSLEYFDVLYE